MINIRGRKTIAKTLLIIIAVILKSSTLNSQFFAVFRTFIDVRFSQLICGKNWHFSFYLKTIIIVSHSGVGFQLSCHLSPAIFLRMSQPFFQNVIATITNFCPASFLSARVAKQDLVIPIWMMKSDRFEKIVIFILYSIFLSDDAKPGILLCNQIFWGKFHAQFKFFKINQNVLFERVLGRVSEKVFGWFLIKFDLCITMQSESRIGYPP